MKNGSLKGKEEGVDYIETVLFALAMISIMIIIMIGAAQFINYLKRKNEEDKKEDGND